MKYYSEITKKLYNTVDVLTKEEQAVREAEEKKAAEEQKKRETRGSRAKEVEEAIKNANEAQAKAIELLKAFTKDYGYFHTSYSYHGDEDEDAGDFMNFFNSVFNIL